MSEQWIHQPGTEWWTRYLAGGDFPIYVCERQDKWYVKVGNRAMLGPFDLQATAFFTAERKALDIAQQMCVELNAVESEAT